MPPRPRRRDFHGTGRLGRAVELALRTEYVYAPYDTCKWWSEQKLTGTLAGGKLRYDYGEGRLEGQTGCATDIEACTADGDVLLRLKGDTILFS